MDKLRTIALFGMAALLLWLGIQTQNVSAHTQPCTIVYEGVPSEPFCQMEMVPDSKGGFVEVYVCR